MIYKMFPDCMLVKGVQRSAVYDLRRSIFKFIPNDLYSILVDRKSIDINMIRQKLNSVDKKIFDDYISFLLQNEFIFSCKKQELDFFDTVDIKYATPYLIHNIVVELDINSTFDLDLIFSNIDSWGCVDLQIKFLGKIDLARIEKILSLTKERRIKSIELIFRYDESVLKLCWVKDLLKEHLRINSVIIYLTPESEIENLSEQYKNCFTMIYFYVSDITDSKCCGFISPEYFTINTLFFMESHFFNNCLNGKLAIDARGNIKNCTALHKTYGNINDANILDIISSSEFQKMWHIRKDEIHVCKDCEFRYMCSDCRVFTQNDDIYGKPIHCTYDPYEMKWSNMQ